MRRACADNGAPLRRRTGATGTRRRERQPANELTHCLPQIILAPRSARPVAANRRGVAGGALSYLSPCCHGSMSSGEAGIDAPHPMPPCCNIAGACGAPFLHRL